MPTITRSIRDRMRYLRSHRAGWALLVIAATYLLTAWLPRVSFASPISPDLRTASIAFPPLVVAVVATAVADTPLDLAERLSPRRLVSMGRLGLTAAVLMIGVGASLWIGASGSVHGYGSEAGARNVVALVGIALLTAAATGVRLSWVGPLVCMSYSGLFIDPQREGSGVWSVLTQPDGHAGAVLTALTLFVTGVVVWVASGMRLEGAIAWLSGSESI
jgi:hypothetical protein